MRVSGATALQEVALRPQIAIQLDLKSAIDAARAARPRRESHSEKEAEMKTRTSIVGSGLYFAVGLRYSRFRWAAHH
jgi:hypothetical protein